MPTAPNRLVWVTMVFLVIVLVVIGVVKQSVKKKPSPINQGTRAVILPTEDAARTVVVPPCATGAAVLTGNVQALMNTTGTTSVEVPQGYGVRVALVPRCTAGRNGLAGTTNLPSAIFVTKQGTSVPAVGSERSHGSASIAAAPTGAEYQLTIPARSQVRTVVVPRCEKASGATPREQILDVTGKSTTVIAPVC